MSATVVLCDASEEQPVASSTRRFTLLAMLYTHLVEAFHRDSIVRVACNRWVDPVSGIASALKFTDISVTFGWPAAETDTRPRVVFDVLAPGSCPRETRDKFAYYEKHGAEEYYILYPEFPMHAEAFQRKGTTLARVADVNGYVSPRTGLRLKLETGELTVFGHHGRPLRTAEEQVAEREKLAAKLRELGVDPDTL